VALIAVDNKQLIVANSPPFCMLVKVLQPLNASLIIGPAVLSKSNNLIV
jgi:hypothetical protein